MAISPCFIYTYFSILSAWRNWSGPDWCCVNCAPLVLQPGPLDTAHFEVWHRFSWRTVIALCLTSLLNPHHSPYCTESTQDWEDFKSVQPGCLIIVVKLEIWGKKLGLSTHDIVVCKHIFLMLQCVLHHFFSWQLGTVSRKADQEAVQNCMKTLLFWFPSHFKSKWVQAPKSNRTCLLRAADIILSRL